MDLLSRYPVQTCEILGRNAEWQSRYRSDLSIGLDQCCDANPSIYLTRDSHIIHFIVLISAGCSHIAAVEVSPLEKTIRITVYGLGEVFKQCWSLTIHRPDDEPFSARESASGDGHPHMHGGITEDGKSVLLIYGVDYGSRVAYLVNARGCTKREPPSDLALGYSGTVGQLSDDSEHLFYVRSGTAFGKNGEAKVVEAYSIRHLATARALTFGFGNGRHLLNVRLLRPLRVRDPIYMAIRTSGFGDGDDRRSSPPLVASSDRKLHRNFAGIGDEGGQRDPQVSISLDGAHMSAVDRDTAMIHHWDLQNPSLRPLGSVRLPGVKYGERRKWLIYGKETTMRDAIPRQIHHIRHSIQGKVVTVVTASASSVVVNVLLTFNLQLIYHQTVQIPPWPAFVPVRIGFCDSAVLNLFAISPIEAASMQPGIGRLSGLTGIHVSFREIGESIREIESYFDSTIDRVESLKKAVYRNDASPEYRYGWTPGVMDRDDDAAISPEVDTPHDSVAEDDRRQRALYETVFGSTDKYAGRTATAQSRRFLVPLLLSFTYSWAPDERVSVFGVVLRYQYSILAVGPTSRKSGQKSEITRVLYTSDVNTGIDHKQHLEFYKSGSTYIMRVFRMNDSIGVYSGAPLPLPRWTIMSPHFLPEDAWYDTFIVKEAAHGTMPDGQMMTPNPVLIYSTSVSAYFEPNTFAIQDIVDYGHRARSGYVIPKFLLWREYGLRGGRPHHPNELLFGGGRWADAMGAHFLSIYDDKTYDDSWPLVPSTFAMACNSDHCAQQTTHVDAFFRRLHQDEERLLDNSRAVSCVLPLACRARPMATLSLMRHITLTSHNVNDIGCVEIKTGATKPRSSKYEGKWGRWRRDLEDLWYAFVAPWIPSHGTHSEPHTSEVTLPLPGFCSFQHRLYKTPPVSATTMWRDDSVWACIRATLPPPNPNWGAQDAWLIESVRASARGPTSPFTRLVEEILDMKDRQTRLSFLRVVWLEKLLAWKVKTFGLHVYLVRSALPMMILFCVHLTLGLLLTGQEADGSRQRTVPVLLLASVEASVSCFIFYVKMRQLYRIPSLFVRSIFNYVDTTAVLLGFATFIQVIRNTARVRSFLAFSTLAIWIATILMLRIFRPVGMLLLLLMETLQGIFSYLVLLSFIILGLLPSRGKRADDRLLTEARVCLCPVPLVPKPASRFRPHPSVL